MISVAVVFFFQAEDVIRDLVRSRGLGDVYKRQVREGASLAPVGRAHDGEQLEHAAHHRHVLRRRTTVSYTHLTLPTSDLV